VSAHIVMPARQSNVPGHWVRRCTGCPWVAYRVDRAKLDRLALEHHDNPADEAAPEPEEGTA